MQIRGKNSVSNLPIIDTEYKELKTDPPQIDLFPNSESPIWKSMNESIIKNQKLKENLTGNIDNKNGKQLIENDEQIQNNDKIVDENNISLKKTTKVQSNNPIKENTDIKNQNIAENITKNFIKKKQNKVEKNEINNSSLELDKTKEKKSYFYIQLASLSEKKLVSKEWKRLKKKYDPNLNNLSYITEKTKLSNDKIYFRLLVGSFAEENEAKNFCKKIKIIKSCIVKTY